MPWGVPALCPVASSLLRLSLPTRQCSGSSKPSVGCPVVYLGWEWKGGLPPLPTFKLPTVKLRRIFKILIQDECPTSVPRFEYKYSDCLVNRNHFSVLVLWHKKVFLNLFRIILKFLFQSSALLHPHYKKVSKSMFIHITK